MHGMLQESERMCDGCGTAEGQQRGTVGKAGVEERRGEIGSDVLADWAPPPEGRALGLSVSGYGCGHSEGSEVSHAQDFCLALFPPLHDK